MFVLELGVSFGGDTGLADGEFAAKNLDEEVAVTASRLQETGIDPIRLRLHKVEHRVHFARIRENLTVCQHPFLGLDLGVHSALSLGIWLYPGTNLWATNKAQTFISTPRGPRKPVTQDKSSPRQKRRHSLTYPVCCFEIS